MSNMIDLDNLFNGNEKKSDTKKKETPAPAPIVESGCTDLIPGGLDIVTNKSSKPAPPPSLSLESIYEKNMKLVYLFDTSGSMSANVIGKRDVEKFIWSEDVMEAIARNVKRAVEKVEQAHAQLASALEGDEEEGDDMPEPIELDPITEAWFECADLTGDALKAAVLEHGLHTEIALSIDYSKTRHADFTDRMQLVKTSARKLIEERYAKYPDADVTAVAFELSRRELGGGLGKEALLDAIQGMIPTGGTDIMAAIDFAMDICKKRPSKMHMHHFVLVTDSEDSGAARIREYLPKFQKAGIVLDFIHVTNPLRHYSSEAAEALIEVCKATGGEYQKVTTPEQFETRFLQASTRLCLPPGK